MTAIVTLLTDFGLRDTYAGVLRGVILSVTPQARVVDLCHQVPAQDVQAGAFLLMTSYAAFPPGTVHLAVVDPGVGTARRIVAVEAGGHTFVGPDNGVLAWAVAAAGGLERAAAVADRRYWRGGGQARISATFHGRDIMAPVAAHLAAGLPLAEVGPAIDRIAGEPFPVPCEAGGGLLGQVVYVDHFGNCVSNIPESALAGGARMSVLAGGREIPVLRTYGETPPGVALALAGSAGLLEVAVANGSAAATLGLAPGDRLTLTQDAANE